MCGIEQKRRHNQLNFRAGGVCAAEREARYAKYRQARRQASGAEVGLPWAAPNRDTLGHSPALLRASMLV